MRITGGLLSRCVLKVPAQGVRPTQDKVRGAIFSALGDLQGIRALDLFAGSGALGLEAWSRGASFVCWVERSPNHFRVIKENVEKYCHGGGAVQCVCADTMEWIKGGTAPDGGGAFDLVMADPPYDRDETQRYLPRLLGALADSRWVRARGMLVYEQSTGEPLLEWSGWTLVKERAYGDTRILYYRRELSKT
jgi:16S rRNA (guanine966-N2)-methyltransferase